MNTKTTPVIRRPIAWATDEIEGELIEFDVKWFKRLRQPGVYFINGYGQMLYIGMARNLLARISSPRHEALIKSFKQAVHQVLMIPAKSEAHARQLEATYIRLHQPRFNIVGKLRQTDSELEALHLNTPQTT